MFILLNAYLVKQAAYIIGYGISASDIDEVLASPGIEPGIKSFLLNVKEIKSFSEKRLGLSGKSNYSTYMALDKGYIVDVVSACRKDSFEEYAWNYPIFGSFPYKGFFERRDAEAEARTLRDKNLDVIIRKVDAFSTLGFFKDPVYDHMASYSELELASTIIHEQTHATLFLANEVQFNEELAVFVAREGALLYLADKYGTDSGAYTEAERSSGGGDAFMKSIRELYATLSGLYSSNIRQAVKLVARGPVMHAARERIRLDSIRKAGGKGAGEPARFPMNNAFIMLYIGYEEDLTPFYDLYNAFDKDLKATIEYISGIEKSGLEPFEYIKTGAAKSRR